jgi:hypothetical protein
MVYWVSSGLVGIDPPDNCVPEFVASDPKLWDVGNHLVGVDPSSAFICFHVVYFLPCILGLPCKDIIDRSTVTHHYLSRLDHQLPHTYLWNFWINIVACLILFAQHA